MNRDVNSERLSQLVNEAKEKIIKSDLVNQIFLAFSNTFKRNFSLPKVS